MMIIQGGEGDPNLELLASATLARISRQQVAIEKRGLRL